MKAHLLLRMTIVLAVVVVGLVFVAVPTVLAAPTPQATVGAAQGETDVVIYARRKISIPFGITSATLVDNATNVRVVGHDDDCEELGTTYKVRVQVRQDTTGAFAKSNYVQFDCDEGWDVLATVQGPTDFEAGEAVEVCAQALVFDPKGGTTVLKWCKELELQ